MRKPIVLWPFIFVYKIVFGILKAIVNFCRYFYLGIFYVLSFIGRVLLGCCYIVYLIPKYFFKGIITTLKFIFVHKKKETNKKEEIKKETVKEEKPVEKENKVVEKENKLEELITTGKITSTPNIAAVDMKEFKRLRLLKQQEIKRIEEEELRRKRNDEINKKRKEDQKRKNDSYVNENVKIEKPSFFQKLKKALNSDVKDKPQKTNSFTRSKKNQELLKREALLINFDGADAEKSDKKILYEYVAKNPDGEIVKDYFEAFSKVEVHSFLLSEGYEVYSIRTNKWIQTFHKNTNVNNTKFKTKDLIFLLTQLSTYIKAGIPLVDALRILEKQYKNKQYKNILKSIVYDLTMGDSFSTALIKQNVAFPSLLINMVKTAEMTGELAEVLDDQAEYYTQVDKIKKQMVSAMIYPAIVFTASIGVAVFIMLYVVPQFVEIYNEMDAASIPAFTLIVLAISEFLKKYIWLILIILAVLVIGFVWLFKNIKSFKTAVQKFLMKLPIIGNAIIYNEVAMFTKTFSSLLSHNVFITNSMEVLSRITNNEIYKMIILDAMTNLSKGEKISTAFENNWAFPIPAYEMLVTGERTGELPEMMAKVSDYYQDLHTESVERIKTVAEPAITIFLTVIVGTLILAIIVPMFSMYSAVQTM